MTTSRRERKKEKNRRLLIECAVALFHEKGFTETSIDEITAKADVARGTLYNYFPDKESILVGYFQDRVASASQGLRASLSTAGDIRQQLAVLLDFMHQAIADDLDLAEIYLRYRLQTPDSGSESFRQSGMEGLVTGIIKEAQEQREIRSDMPASILARNLLFLLATLFTHNAQGDDPDSKNLGAEQIIELFLTGAGTE